MILQDEGMMLERIATAAARRPNGVVAFDADGTLWGGDVGEDWLSVMRSDDSIARAWLDETHAADADPAAEERLMELVALGLTGRSAEAVSAYAQRVIAPIDWPSRLHGETIAMLSGIARLDVDIFVVSASPRAIVEACVSRLGIATERVVATTPMFRDGVMVGEVERPIPYGEGKVTCLRRAIGDRPWLAAFADNHFDAAMLRACEIAVAVRPKAALRRIADSIPGLVELAPRTQSNPQPIR